MSFKCHWLIQYDAQIFFTLQYSHPYFLKLEMSHVSLPWTPRSHRLIFCGRHPPSLSIKINFAISPFSRNSFFFKNNLSLLHELWFHPDCFSNYLCCKFIHSGAFLVLTLVPASVKGLCYTLYLPYLHLKKNLIRQFPYQFYI